MPMTVVVTRNVSDRMRGFLASSMLELTAGVYTAPRLSTAVRKRICEVLEDWWSNEQDASLIMLWADNRSPGGQAVWTLGIPPIDLVEIDGLILARRDSPPSAH
jgi:CRISPR-associated protein Cas2